MVRQIRAASGEAARHLIGKCQRLDADSADVQTFVLESVPCGLAFDPQVPAQPIGLGLGLGFETLRSAGLTAWHLLWRRFSMKLGHPITHVIFDLDGVLLDTERLYTVATNAVVARYGKRYTWAIKKDMMGRSEEESAHVLIDRLRLPLGPDEYLRLRNEVLYSLLDRTEPLEGASELVLLLRAQEIPMAVATSSRRELFERKTRRHDWFGEIRLVVCGDDPEMGAFKPAPDIFLLTAGRLGVAPDRCVVFEDSPAGVQAAAAAGMQVVAVADANLDASEFPEATFLIRGYDELSLEDLGL